MPDCYEQICSATLKMSLEICDANILPNELQNHKLKVSFGAVGKNGISVYISPSIILHFLRPHCITTVTHTVCVEYTVSSLIYH